MATFIDPFTDTGFKIVFGKEDESDEILRAFLNVLFENDPDFSPIETITYRPSERTREWTGGKSIVYDIFCETSTGHKFIVEMQKNPQEFFLSRAVYYVSRAIADQGYKGKRLLSAVALSDADDPGEAYWDYEVMPVVGVFFSSFFIDGLERKLVTRSRLCDTETHKPVGDYMRYVFIQLPAFRKSAEECKDKFDQWIYNLKNMKTMETMQFTSHQDIFNRLASVGNLATLSPDERFQYEYDLKKARDYHAEMAYARKLARNEGLEEGRREGMQQGMKEGMQQGMQQGMKEGMQQGMKEGMQQGMKEGMQQGMREGMQQGMKEGMKEGMQQGIRQGKQDAFREIALKMMHSGMSLIEISEFTGIPIPDLETLSKN